MSRAVSRFRALFVAVAVLALTAGVVAASHSGLSLPSAAADGLERAAEAAGKTVPVADPVVVAPPVVQADDEESDEDQPSDEAPADEVAADHPDNHGKTVSEAATGPTPEGSDTHGQYVRMIATDNHGQEVAAEKRPDQATKTKPSR